MNSQRLDAGLAALFDIMDFHAQLKDPDEDKVWARVVEKLSVALDTEAATYFSYLPLRRQLLPRHLLQPQSLPRHLLRPLRLLPLQRLSLLQPRRRLLGHLPPYLRSPDPLHFFTTRSSQFPDSESTTRMCTH